MVFSIKSCTIKAEMSPLLINLKEEKEEKKKKEEKEEKKWSHKDTLRLLSWKRGKRGSWKVYISISPKADQMHNLFFSNSARLFVKR